jgi:ABC-type transport system involved in cytochrome bd biosynthesis fused ATPase/permease subunit
VIRITFALIAAVAIAIGGYYVFRPSAGPGGHGGRGGPGGFAIPVEAAKVRVDTVVRDIPAVGTLRSVESVMIRPEVPGLIAATRFDEGAPVAKGAILVTLDDAIARAITRTTEDGASLHLKNLSVELDDGTVVIDDADVMIQPGEKILLLGESGTGKTTLTRAIAGLWPWGQGNVAIPKDSKILMMPQRPYIPLGTLRRAATYPLSREETPDATVEELLHAVGLEYLIDRLNEEAPWHRTLSGGECQRLAFVRLMLHRPDIVVLDEATSALDLKSQEKMMELLMDRLLMTTVISIGHRPELEAFHYRKLVFERQPGAIHQEKC